MLNLSWQPVEPYTSGVDRLITAAEAHDGFKAISDQALIDAKRGERRTLLAQGEDDLLVGFGVLGSGELDLLVHPDARGAGVGRAMFNELLGRASVEDEAPVLRAWVHGDTSTGRDAAEAMLTGAGFHPIRTLLRLQLAGSALDARPRSQHGLSLTPYDESHASEVVRVNAAAFANHPEQGRLTLEGFREITREPWFDAADLLLLFDDAGDRLLAFTWIKTLRDAPGGIETELYVIGVHPDAAGRGLGTRLLEATLDHMAEHQPTRVTLYVEGDNAPALALYERAGFTPLQRSSQWARG